jgi:excisionase family DNA binding protein
MNKKETAAELGITPRTLERHMSAGRIAYVIRKGKTGDEAYFEPETVEQFRAANLAPVIPGKVEQPSQALATTSRDEPRQALARRNGSVSLAPVSLDTGDALDTPDMRARMLVAFEAMASPVRLADKLTLSLTEAALLSGLSRGHLREAIRAGKLKARIIGRGWKVKRDDLDLYVRKL